MTLHLIATALLLSATPPLSSGSDGGAEDCRFSDGRSAIRHAVTSFGAEGVGSHLYVFSGHVGRTHAHSQENLDPHFIRYGCDGDVEELPSGGAVQGTALVAFDGEVIAVGGLSARNATAEEPEDLVSVATVRRFDRDSQQWIDLPDLPRPRSSHDAAVLGGKLYVVGGWQLRGIDQEPVWTSEMAVLDLEATTPAWDTITQPFKKRALAVTHDGEHLVVVGGMSDDEQTTASTHIYDIGSGTWSTGPDLPTQRGLKGFGLAAEFVQGHAVVSPAGGTVYALVGNQGQRAWKGVAELNEARFFHELAVVSDTLYAIAGTSRRAHLDSVEAVDLFRLRVETHGSVKETQEATEEVSWAGFRHGSALAPPETQSFEEQWRTGVPGYGQSSPVIWSSADLRRVYVTSTEGPELETQHLFAIDLDTGARLWSQSIDSTERFENRDTIARAASSPAVDEDRIYSLFGSGDLIAVDHTGTLVWQRDLATDYGSFGGNHGVGSSVVRTADAVVVSIARKTYAYVVALDPTTGATRWKTDRQPGPGWTTPVLVDGGVLLVGGTGRLDGLDVATGDLLWTVEGLGGNNVSSPTFRWVPEAQREQAQRSEAQSTTRFQIAVAATRSGGVSVLGGADPRQEPQLLWQNDVSSHYSSPMFQGPCLLTTNGVGALFCFDPATGDELWRERLAGPIWATPLQATDGSVLAVSEKATLQRLVATAEGLDARTVAALDLDGRTYGAAAHSNRVVLRSGSALIAVKGSP